MSFQEEIQQSNMEQEEIQQSNMEQEEIQQSNIEQEQCNYGQSFFNHYKSQLTNIKNKMNSDKQEEQQIKLYVEERQNMIKEILKFPLQNENENLTEKAVIAKELQNEVLKKILLFHELTTNNIENINLLQELMKMCINTQEHLDEVKKDVLNSFEKIKLKNDAKERAFEQKLREMSESLENCKLQNLKNVVHFETLKEKDEVKIFQLEGNNQNIKKQLKRTKKDIDAFNRDFETLKEEEHDMLNKFSEYQKILENINEQTKEEEFEQNKEILDLNSTITNLNDEFLKLDNELEDCKKGYDNRIKFLNQLKNQNITAEETISTLKIKCAETETEITDLEKQQHESECEDQSKIHNLIKQNEELTQNHVFYEEEKKALEKELSEIKTEINDFNTEMNDYDLYSKDIKNELKQEQDKLEENFDIFESEKTTLEKYIDNEDQQEISLDKNLQELQDKLDELNDEYARLNVVNDAITAEVALEEITKNADVDSLKNEINEVNLKNEEILNEISEILSDETEITEQIKTEYEEIIKNKISEFNDLKQELDDFYHNDQKNKSEEMVKLKESSKNLELYISELKDEWKNLHEGLDEKICEVGKLHEELNNIKGFENELNKNAAETFKIPSNDYIIPKLKIPVSKYSSTSDSSSEEMKPKKRRVSYKLRRTADKKMVAPKNTLGVNSQKSIDEIFDALKTNPGSEARRNRKRTIKKSVF